MHPHDALAESADRTLPRPGHDQGLVRAPHAEDAGREPRVCPHHARSDHGAVTDPDDPQAFRIHPALTAEPIETSAAVTDHLRFYVLIGGAVAVLRDPDAIQEGGAAPHLQGGEPLACKVPGDRSQRETHGVVQDGEHQDPRTGDTLVRTGEIEATNALVAKAIRR